MHFYCAICGAETNGKVELTVKKRRSDYIVYPKNQKDAYETGGSVPTAISQWIKTHGAEYGIEYNIAPNE